MSVRIEADGEQNGERCFLSLTDQLQCELFRNEESSSSFCEESAGYEIGSE